LLAKLLKKLCISFREYFCKRKLNSQLNFGGDLDVGLRFKKYMLDFTVGRTTSGSYNRSKSRIHYK